MLGYVCWLSVIFNFGAADKFVKDLSEYNITQIIQILGYPVQTHEVVTEDGYLLDVYRIPHGAQQSKNEVNPNPVLLHHGLMGTAEQYTFMGPNKSLGFLLADRGYDVWIMNDRGTIHSRKHVRKNPDTDESFWMFTFHEIALYDLTATIDYILKDTKKPNLHYVGHSQGVATVLVMGSERPDYNEKIKVMIGLAPATYLRKVHPSIVTMLVPFYKRLAVVLDLVKLYEIPPSSIRPRLIELLKYECANDYSPGSLCRYILDFGGEEDSAQIDEKWLPLIVPSLAAGASAKQFAHFAQIIKTGTFGAYNWGRKENLRRYNSTVAPLYNVRRVTYPTALFVGENDAFVSVEDVTSLARKLPNVIEVYKVPFKKFTHNDFLWAKDIFPLSNRRVIEIMNKYVTEI